MIGKTGKRNNRCSVHRVYMGGRALHEANEKATDSSTK